MNIKDVIKQQGYSVTSLAEKIGMTQVSLSRIINGNPTLETMQKLADALGVAVKDFFEPDEEHETIYIKKDNEYVPIGEIKKHKL